MSKGNQRVLIYSADTATADRVFELCEQSSAAHLRLVVCRSEAEVENQLEHQSFSLAFVDMDQISDPGQLDRIAFALSPNPTIALVNGDDAPTLLMAMRNGADSVFTRHEMESDPLPLVYCLERQLHRAATIDQVQALQESLSRSLDELKADQDAARQIQERLLPLRDQELLGLRCRYRLQPSMMLSGDFVDLIPIDATRLLFYLADVSGHGASSALVTVMLKHMTNQLVRGRGMGPSPLLGNPERLLRHINHELLYSSLGKHLTMFVGIIDTEKNTLDYAVGGHHPMPILVQPEQAGFLTGRGMPVGLFDEAQFERVQLSLDECFRIFLFSDGILELLEGDNLEQKEQNLLKLCREGEGLPDELLQRLISDAAAAPDDVAIMTVSREC